MFTSHFLKQNDLIEEGKHKVKNATTFNMPTVGIINGMTDIEAMVLGNLDYARNNTYDHPIINETSYTELMGMLTAPADKGGCLALLETCRTAQAKLDVEMSGANPTVNKACGAAAQACFGLLANGFDEYTDVGFFPPIFSQFLSRSHAHCVTRIAVIHMKNLTNNGIQNDSTTLLTFRSRNLAHSPRNSKLPSSTSAGCRRSSACR